MGLAIDLLVVLALVAALSLASRLLGPRPRMEGDKGMPYETGMPPLAQPGAHPWASYYRFAVLFVIFDVDLAFLAPWLVQGGRPDAGMLVALTAFLGLVGFTLAYVWRKGALEC
ncbi:MAG TPA: NADH-quinone oxidoreductase subunit A [Elusimicrobiota bacterium]|jgi:NADH-quinone oxidoreductase subunit A|nr:NADH-quinone oxidoreductase subunit A [Elusimicrobiota bacterium]